MQNQQTTLPKPCLILFVTATRLERVAKAAATGVQMVAIDLEDAVEKSQKQAVREQLLAFDQAYQGEYWLRVNADQELASDIKLLGSLTRVKGVLLPKCQNRTQVEYVSQATDLPVIAVIETAIGVQNIADIATAKGLVAMTFGCLDLMQSFGVRLGSVAAGVMFDRIRGDLLLHSLVNGLNPPIETIFVDFADEIGMQNAVRHWLDFGFGGQLLIHPKQVAIANAVIDGHQQRQFASQIWQTYQKTGQAVFAIDGKMVDLPLIIWAANLLGETPPS